MRKRQRMTEGGQARKEISEDTGQEEMDECII